MHDSDTRHSKFTAGPWEYRIDYGNKFIVSGDEGTSGNAYGEANARLISTAPDLLTALEAAIEHGMVPNSTAKHGGAPKHASQVHVADQIRAAIAKARGK